MKRSAPVVFSITFVRHAVWLQYPLLWEMHLYHKLGPKYKNKGSRPPALIPLFGMDFGPERPKQHGNEVMEKTANADLPVFEPSRFLYSITQKQYFYSGETQANKEQRIQGHLDIPLSSVGEIQASQAGMSLCKAAFSRVYASDLCRAYTTCERILKENCCLPPPIKVDTRLRERNFGSVEGMNIEEVKTMAAAEGLTWPQFNPEGAETLGALQARMASFFKDVCQSVFDKNRHQRGEGNEDTDDIDVENLQPLEESAPVENILVVSHGAALKQLFVHLHKTLSCPVPGDPDILNRIPPNTGITEYLVRFSPKRYMLQCVRMHDDGHLQDL